MTTASAVFQLLGLCLEVAGVLRMANGYTSSATPGGALRIVVSALVRGATARGAASIAHLSPEDRLKSLQGLAVVGLGFLVQACGTSLLLLDGS
jgi:hypothetical protein